MSVTQKVFIPCTVARRVAVEFNGAQHEVTLPPGCCGVLFCYDTREQAEEEGGHVIEANIMREAVN